MSIAIDSVVSSAAAAAPAGTPRATKDEFMTLFVAQLRNQDPLSPQDPSAFVAQLAQLSQLEQTAESNTRLGELADQQAAAVRANLSALVGHELTSMADSFQIVSGGATPPSLRVHLEGAAATASINILNSAGNIVRSIDLGARGAGDATLSGSDLAGLAPGSYRLTVDAKNQAGTAIAGNVSLVGIADSLELGPDGGRFHLGNVSVTPGAIISVGATAPSEVQ
jgi:flagellar basal-body rod modification protein FlgD